MMTVDLTNCDIEPIHIPGNIQAHGFLAGFNVADQSLTYVSDNISQLTGLTAKQLIGKSLAEFMDLFTSGNNKLNYIPILEYASQTDFENINPVSIVHNTIPYNLVVHRSGDTIILEFEPAKPEIDKELQGKIGISLARILEARNLKQTLEFAARQIRDIIGYDRVMIYQFWEDGHGEVVAEDKEAKLEPFWGLHYPASDIPKQARELYKINLVRIISDVHATPQAILSHPSLKDQPLDLTHSTLRAVSPIHIEYLKNMGVMASFSVSIVINEQLWGLIACHNYTPKFIDYKSRNSTKLIGQILSSSVELRLGEQQKEQVRRFQSNIHTLIHKMMKDWDIPGSLLSNDVNLMDITRASGVVFMFENKIYHLGITPDDDHVKEIENWFHQNVRTTLYHTDSLSKEYAPAESFKDKASGILFCSLSRELHECIIWFKPEIIRTVKWAGNPDKPVEFDASGRAKLSPRRSFDVWTQQVAATSEPWTTSEIGSAMKLREEIIHIVNQKANQIRILNEKLQKAYDELDTFSFTISHDLKTPLSSIRNYAEIIQEDYTQLPDDVKNILTRIIRAADRMNVLIKEVLSYSRIGREELSNTKLDMKKIIEQARSENMVALGLNKTEFIVRNTPQVPGDNVMISQVFNNLIGNALKYSAKSPNPRVIVEGVESGNEIIYTIEDNGIGIDMQYGNQIFELFKRLESAREYEGTGVGLAIVKRIMEKHQGKIWYESEKGAGTKFYLSFNT